MLFSATGPNAYDVVSNTVALQATVTDLSGVTNESFEVTVDGLPARYSLGASNTIDLETKYNPNGPENIYLNTANAARIYDTNNPPDNSKFFFSGSASIPLDFENDTYLAFASDFCPPELGTNNIYFVVNKEQNITATISDPSNGQVVAAFSGHVPYLVTIVIPWNFTEADGVTEYSNDTYAVTFTASDPVTLTFTNTIDRSGARSGAGCFLTYQEQDPVSPNGGGINNYLNQQADTWVNQTLKSLYTDLYDPFSLTQYTTDQVGTNRNHSACQPLDAGMLIGRIF